MANPDIKKSGNRKQSSTRNQKLIRKFPGSRDAKDRIASCRLTAKEYQQLCELGASSGSRSIAQLVRMAVLNLLKSPQEATQPTVEFGLAQLESRVQELSQDIANILRKLARQDAA